jgi:hypothetical protein
MDLVLLLLHLLLAPPFFYYAFPFFTFYSIVGVRGIVLIRPVGTTPFQIHQRRAYGRRLVQLDSFALFFFFLFFVFYISLMLFGPASVKENPS